jgi:hypothetical protein
MLNLERCNIFKIDQEHYYNNNLQTINFIFLSAYIVFMLTR